MLKAEAIQPVKLTGQLDDNFPATGGRAELLRAFRGTQPLLVKISFDQAEAAAELQHAYNQLGAYFP